MKKTWLVGDSGGTGTDWCLVDENGARTYFSTQSYQPVHFSAAFFEQMADFWRSMGLHSDTEIHFYGAGCSMKHNQETLTAHFNSLGFRKVFVESDLLGTCRGLLGNSAGLAGILGTGSVLAEYNGKEITGIHGGFGYLVGDEGSGYTFGKKLISRFLNQQFSEGYTAELAQQLGDRAEILKQVYAQNGKKWISDLAAATGRNPETESIHRENISEFIEMYLLPLKKDSKHICFSGSYAFHNVEILSSVLHENGWALDLCIQKPIIFITDYTIKVTL